MEVRPGTAAAGPGGWNRLTTNHAVVSRIRRVGFMGRRKLKPIFPWKNPALKNPAHPNEMVKIQYGRNLCKYH